MVIVTDNDSTVFHRVYHEFMRTDVVLQCNLCNLLGRDLIQYQRFFQSSFEFAIVVLGQRAELGVALCSERTHFLLGSQSDGPDNET